MVRQGAGHLLCGLFICKGFVLCCLPPGLKIRKVLALLHRDLHQPEVLEAVSQLASSVVTVTSSPESNGPRTEFLPYAVATTILKRKSGKLLKKVCCVFLIPPSPDGGDTHWGTTLPTLSTVSSPPE